MEILNNLLLGFSVVSQPSVLFYCFLGVVLGTLVGALPGIGPLTGISLLLPFSFHLEPTSAIILLAGIYYGAQYGGSTSSILLNIAGTASSAVICLEGHPMTKQGRAGVALFLVAIASFFGSLIGIAILAVMAPLLAQVALQFSAPEYFSLMLIGLIAASMFGGGSPLRGFASVVLGMLLGLVGMDVVSGQFRFVFGEPGLMDGISLVAIALGLFGIAEVISAATSTEGRAVKQKISFKSMLPNKKDMKEGVFPAARGSVLGSILGFLPGTGPTISSFMAYMLEIRVSRNPKKFRNGAIEGLVAPESANNAAAQTGFIPTLTLGIPGDPVMALMMGALIINGLTPGPVFLQDNPTLFWGLIVSFLVGNVMLLVLNIPLIGIWVKLLSVPYKFLFPAIVGMICLGVYSINRSTLDIGIALLFGLLGYGMRALRFDPASILLGLVLGPLLEENLRRAMIMSHGSLKILIERPIAAGLLICALLMVVWTIVSAIKAKNAAGSYNEAVE